MKNNKYKNYFFLIVIGLVFSLINACDKKENFPDDLLSESPSKESFDFDTLNPELRDTVYFAYQYDEEDARYLSIKAFQKSGEIITLINNPSYIADRLNTACYDKGKIYLYDGFSLKSISLSDGDGNYKQERIIDLAINKWITDIAICGDSIFYSYLTRTVSLYDKSDPVFRYYIGKYDLVTEENDETFLSFGFHEINELASLGDNKLIYTESYDEKNLIKILDLVTNDEVILTRYGEIRFVYGEKIVYCEFAGYRIKAYYEYCNNEVKLIADEIESYIEEDPGILPYKNGYIFISDASVYYYDGTSSSKIMSVSKNKYDYIDSIEFIPPNIVKIYIFEHMDGNDETVVIKYNLDTYKTKKINFDREEDETYYFMNPVFFFSPIVYEEQIITPEEKNDFVGKLKILDSGINYRSQPKISSKTKLGTLKKNNTYNVYSYEPCEPFKKNKLTINGWYLIEVKGKKVYVADISKLMKFTPN